ncbi:MAG: UDP-glucose 4-epimerase GalE [Bacteriovoracaceae bacterium]|nr:UDP-glucose 4-epimerase GalE [Bacteriovoracaceae bacterium]
MRSIVITGGNGYIGSHMCKLMNKKGFDVHIIDNHSTSPQAPVHKYGTFHHFDIADKKRAIELFNKIRPESIFHFAARAVVPESESNPMLYYNENLVKTISLLESAIEGGVKKFVFSSTCATFGEAGSENISEDTPQNPINTYGRTKLLMEQVMHDLASKDLLDVIVFRYFNAAGSCPEGTIGENHDPESHLIPNIVRAHLSGGLNNFKIFGDKFNTPDGSCVRDYIHVEDLVMAHFEGFNYLDKNHGFHDFNLGSENGYSVKEVVTAFEDITKKELKKEICDPRPGDPPRLVGDSKKARKELNFKPQYNLGQCIAHTLKYLTTKNEK